MENAKTRVDKTAHFLDFCAKEGPYIPFGYNLVVQAVDGLSRTPNQSSDQVRLMADSMTAVRRKLMSDYGRGLDTVKGLGVRATVDDDDLANTQLRRNVGRLVGSKRSLEQTRALIDTAKMKNQSLKSWVSGGVTRMLNEMNAENRLAKLLPPKPGSEGEK
jgi:hypothetical protein